MTKISRKVNDDMEDIAVFYKELVKLTGLPPWALIVLSIFLIIAVYLYGILIPISLRRIRKEIISMNQKLGILLGEPKEKYHKNGTSYKWKT